MAHFLKNTRRFPIRSLHFTYWSNLNAVLLGKTPADQLPDLAFGEWSSCYFTQSRIELLEQTLNTPNGVLFEYSLNAFLPGNFPELSAALSSVTGKPHVVLLELESGQRLMLGNEHVGASFRFQQSNTALGATLTWELTDTEPAYQQLWEQQLYYYMNGDDGIGYQLINPLVFDFLLNNSQSSVSGSFGTSTRFNKVEYYVGNTLEAQQIATQQIGGSTIQFSHTWQGSGARKIRLVLSGASHNTLDLSHNGIIDPLPAALDTMYIRTFKMDGNPVTAIPPELRSEFIHFDDTGLKTTLPGLPLNGVKAALYARNNQLTVIDPDLGASTSLILLNIRNNQVTEIPDFTAAESLAQFNVAENPLLAITPGLFSNKRHLRDLNFQDCAMAQPLVDQILAELVASLSVRLPIPPMRVILTGNAAPGTAGQADVTTLRNAGHTVDL